MKEAERIGFIDGIASIRRANVVFVSRANSKTGYKTFPNSSLAATL
jgi:hypothetical protein